LLFAQMLHFVWNHNPDGVPKSGRFLIWLMGNPDQWGLWL
jgi:hypothetical protein